MEICIDALSRECSAEGEVICSNEYETGIVIIFSWKSWMIGTPLSLKYACYIVCETTYQEHDVEEDMSNCTTELVEMCKTDELGQVLYSMSKTYFFRWCSTNMFSFRSGVIMCPRKTVKWFNRKPLNLHPRLHVEKRWQRSADLKTVQLLRGRGFAEMKSKQ